MPIRKIHVIAVLFFVLSSISFSQTDQSLIKEGAPKVFIDCSLCDINYIKEKIQIVNYVNDRKDADVHILFVTQGTGASGSEYSLFFIGQNHFSGSNDTIKFTTNQTDTEDNTREKTVNALKLGLVRYIGKSKVADQMIISFKEPKQQEEKPVDYWDFWYFQTSVSGSTSGQERSSFNHLSGSLSAVRVTEDLKIYLKLSNSYSESNFKYDDANESIEIKSISRGQSFIGSIYFSVDEHWSWGFDNNLFSSTYSNIAFGSNISPAVEFNIFPYSQSNQRRFLWNYGISLTYNEYSEETIYLKKEELLLSQRLSASVTIIEPWGNTYFKLTGANYFHDFNKYELNFYGSVSWKIVKGLSLSVYGGYSKIRNQISLARGNATLEEVLLQRRQLETNYSYYGGLGISFSFGSIYNNIVNPRFGSGNSSIITYY